MSQPWETIATKCLRCGGKMKVPAARRRRERRLGIEWPDFCSKACESIYIATKGREAQEEQLRKQINP